MSIRQKINWKDFTFRQKLEYIWDYYRYWILAVVCCAFFIGYTAYEEIAFREPLMNVIMLNAQQKTENAAEGFNEFLDSYGYEKYKGAVSVNNSLRFVETKDMEYQNYQFEQYLFALVNTGEQEIFFGNDQMFMTYVDEGMLLDLRQIIPEELLLSYEDQLIYSDYFGQEKCFPCAVCITNNRFLFENQYYDERCYVGVFYNADQPEIAADFMEFLLLNK